LIEKLVHGDTMPLKSALAELDGAFLPATLGTFPVTGAPAFAIASSDIQASIRDPPHAD
jgi:hypothetical protein